MKPQPLIKIEPLGHVVFDWNTGLKLRYQYNDKDPYIKSETPELVDVKITDFCNYGCHFCYQSSTKEGIHASPYMLKNIVNLLSDMSVFEIAIGGGEPVTHPDFIEFIEYCDWMSVKPSFTTFGKAWLKDARIVEAVHRFVGGIGVSVHSTKEISKYHKISNEFPEKTVMAQHVFGLLPFDQTLELVKNCEHILFLGYKSVGFATFTNQPFQYSNDQLDMLFQHANNLSVDTAFQNSYNDYLTSRINPLRMVAREGGFSCYIDAVTEKMAPSSYGTPDTMTSLLLNIEEFKAKYKEY